MTQIRLLESLRHPHIVGYRESFRDQRGVFNIILDFCEQGDLYTKIRQEPGTPLEESQILDWISQILISLEYLHANKVIHRDLKTQNIFISRGRLVLGDFGISKRLDHTQDLANTYIGTPYYMSPELFNYQSYSFKSDIWSLGCVIYELCNRSHAFSAQTINGLAVKILKGDYNPPNEAYSAALRQLIASLLQVDQEQRPSLEHVMALPLFNQRVLGDLELALDADTLTFDQLVAVEHQVARLSLKGVFSEGDPQLVEIRKKLTKRKDFLFKEKRINSILLDERGKSNYSNNFELEFDESIESCMSHSTHQSSPSGISYELEVQRDRQGRARPGQLARPGLFDKKKQSGGSKQSTRRSSKSRSKRTVSRTLRPKKASRRKPRSRAPSWPSRSC